MGKFSLNALFSKWQENEQTARRLRNARVIFGGLLLVFGLFSLLSVLSYFATWRYDASLVSGATDSEPVHNIAGMLGWRWAHTLVSGGFGLASLLLVLAILATGFRMVFHKWRFPLGTVLFFTLSGTFVFSVALGFAGSVLPGGDNAFGCGLGGDFGTAFTALCNRHIGRIVTIVLTVGFLAAWVYLLMEECVYPLIAWLRNRPKGSSAETLEDEEEMPEEEEYVPEYVDEEPEKEEILPPEEPVVPVEPAPQPLVPEQPKEEKKPVRRGQVSDQPVDPVTGLPLGLEVQPGEEFNTEIQKELPRINNRDDLPSYRFPSLELLEDYASGRKEVPNEELVRNNNKIRATLRNYKIEVVDVKAVVGPTVTLYKVYPAPGVKISSIRNLQEDIAMSLNARGVRVVTLSDSVGIEVANDAPSIVPLRALLNDKAFRASKAELPVAIGYTITQKVKIFDLADAPHLLVAGATKQGKSVGLNVIVSSLLYAKHPSELKFVFIDPKMVEFSSYARLLYHYLAVLPTANDEKQQYEQAIVKNSKSAAEVLRSLCVEMDDRYELLSKAMVNNIKLYNEKYKDRHLLPTEGHRFLPYLVCVIDEYADLTMSVGAGGEAKALAKSITTSVIRLAQKGRAAGIHVILATQRPTVDVVTGLIKTNFPMRIAFRVTSRVDSQTILDVPGAEKLIGKGDMLLYNGIEMERVQCAFISNDEILSLTDFVAGQNGYKKSYSTPYYLPEPPSEQGEDGSEAGSIDIRNLDERFEEAARLVVQTQRGSTSDLQRRLGMGYAKAGRVMDQLEAAGIVGPQAGSKPREVLVADFNELEPILKSFLHAGAPDNE